MRNIAYALIVAALLVPAAAADYYEGKPDCPPDEFCTTSVDDPDRPVHHDVGDEEPIECVEDEVPCHRGSRDNEEYVQAPEGAEVGITSEEDAKDASGFALLAAIGAIGLFGAVLLARRK